MYVSQVDTFYAKIYITGDLAQIKNICRKYCITGLCVSVTPTEFIYTGGSETGAIVGLINYPRFPTTKVVILKQASELAHLLMKECCQRSCTVEAPTQTFFYQNEDITVPK